MKKHQKKQVKKATKSKIAVNSHKTVKASSMNKKSKNIQNTAKKTSCKPVSKKTTVKNVQTPKTTAPNTVKGKKRSSQVNVIHIHI